MKKAILMVMLAAVSDGAWAQQWVKVAESGSGTVYIDPTTIRRNGDLRRFWQLVDLVRPDTLGNLSYRDVHEVNCKDERGRILQGDQFRGQMAGGQRSGGFSQPGEWDLAAPGTVAWRAMEFVCSR